MVSLAGAGRSEPHDTQKSRSCYTGADAPAGDLDTLQTGRADTRMLLEVLRAVKAHSELAPELQELFAEAVHHGLAECYGEDQLIGRLQVVEEVILDAREELREIAETARNLLDRRKTTDPEDTETLLRKAREAAAAYDVANGRYHLLIRESRDPVARAAKWIQSLIGGMTSTWTMAFTKSSRPDGAAGSRNTGIGSGDSAEADVLEEAHRNRVAALTKWRAVQTELIDATVREQHRRAENEALQSRRQAALNRRDQAKETLEELRTLQPTTFGFARLTDEGALLLGSLSRPGADLTEPAGIFLERLAGRRRQIADHITAARECHDLLTKRFSYPARGAELVSWYLINQQQPVADSVQTFHECYKTVCRFVAPSYTQLLLSLQIQSTGSKPFETIDRLSKISKNLPNFERSQRYLVARVKDLIPGQSEPEKQKRLMQFVDLLTGPLGEHLVGFERYLLAARLAALPGEFNLLADRFGFVTQGLQNFGIQPSYKMSLAALTLMRSSSRGDARLDPFRRAYETLRAESPHLAEELLVPCAFLAVLPGDPLKYLDCLQAARAELETHGYSQDQATALALPAALPALRGVWEDQIQHEAVTLARQVNDLDNSLAERAFADHREEIRRTRLEEELLASLTRLQALYASIDEKGLPDVWKSMAEVATAKTALELDETPPEKEDSGSPSSTEPERQPSLRELVDGLLEEEERVREEMRGVEQGEPG